MNRIIIIFFILVFLDGLIKGLPLFDYFIEGSKQAIAYLLPLFSTLLAFMLFVSLLKTSGTLLILNHLIEPLFLSLHLPADVFLMGLLRPISANACYSLLYSFYDFYGVDHPLSFLATLIQSGSDTTLYVVTLYFSSIHMKKTGYCLPIGLFMDFLSFLLSLIFYIKMFV